MCFKTLRCRDEQCKNGACGHPKKVAMRLLYWLPNYKRAIGKRQYDDNHKINAIYSDKARAAKQNPNEILSPRDLSNVKKMVDKFDCEISGTIIMKESISIEALLEGPLLIAHEIWETEEVDQDARRYFSIFIQ